MYQFVATIRRNLRILERKFAEDRDQFFLLRCLAFLYALRNNSTKGVFQRVLWLCQLSVAIMVIGSYCYRAYWYLMHTELSFATFNIVGTIWILASALMRGIIFDRAVTERLVRFLNDRSFREDEEPVRAARFQVQQQNNRYLIVISFALLLETCIFSPTNVLHQPEFMLSYKGEAVGGIYIQLLYGAVSCIVGSLYAMVFAFIYVLLNVFCAEMSILVESFERINDCFRKYQPCLNTVSARKQEAAFWEELQGLVKVNVQRHVELLEHLDVYRKVLKPFSFVQYYGSLVVIAYYCFILMYKGVTRFTASFIGVIAILVVEPFLFCKRVSQINDLHSQIGSVMYELEWYEKLRYSPCYASVYRQMRASFLIIIIRSQRPLSFTLNGVGTISMSYFAELMNSCYSCVALLFQLKNEIVLQSM